MTHCKTVLNLYSLPISDFTVNCNVVVWFREDLFHRNLGPFMCVKYTIKP